jgi:hypothetical protein
LKPFYLEEINFVFQKKKNRISYQILTCVSVSDNDNARLSRSQTDKYLVCLNLFSNATNCSYVNAVRARRGFDGLSVVDELVDDDFDLSPSLIDAFKSSSCVLSPASDRQTSNTTKKSEILKENNFYLPDTSQSLIEPGCSSSSSSSLSECG